MPKMCDGSGTNVLSPRTLFLQDVLSKLPAVSIVKDVTTTCQDKELHNSCSPPLKRKRISSSSSYHSSPDIRKKILVKNVEMKIASASSSASSLKEESVIDVNSSCDDNSLSLEEKNDVLDSPNANESVVDLTNDSVIEVPSDVPSKDDNKSPLSDVMKSPVVSAKSPTPTKKVDDSYIVVKRSRRKYRVYIIEATVDDDKVRIIHKAEDHLKIPACINGRKPFTIVPGIDYGHDEEVVGEALTDKNDEEELKQIRNEKYLLDSFCCDAGYLSDEELNETPSTNKTVSKVKQIRRANNIKDKRKFEKLSEPQVLGPFWWTGKGGSKKELKKWQPLVFTPTPIGTKFSQEMPTDHDEVNETVAKPVEADTAPVQDIVTKSAAVAPVTDTNYQEKYSIKYMVKYLVQQRMRNVNTGVTGQSFDDGSNLVSSTPAPGRIKSTTTTTITQEHLKSLVLNQNNEMCSKNEDLVNKYIAKYFNKYSFPVLD